ncbi:hypothetical protein GOBAR_DD20989 [Gossypium barbadense]|nr:hypothetical protein GOBAR_DD20989 [Gossypium barbadense]
MAVTVIFHLLLLFPLKHQRVVSSSCSLTVFIFHPLLLLPIKTEIRKGRSLAPCSDGGGEVARVRKSKRFLCLERGENKRELRGDQRAGNEEDGMKMDGRDDLEMGLERKWRKMSG